MLKIHNFQEAYRKIFPKKQEFSRYHTHKEKFKGATRLDRIYLTRNLNPTTVKYVPNPFSDHYSFITKINHRKHK